MIRGAPVLLLVFQVSLVPISRALLIQIQGDDCSQIYDECRKHSACIRLWRHYKSACKVERHRCRMKSDLGCFQAYEYIRKTPLFQCKCDTAHEYHGLKCHRVQVMVQHNRCIDKIYHRRRGRPPGGENSANDTSGSEKSKLQNKVDVVTTLATDRAEQIHQHTFRGAQYTPPPTQHRPSQSHQRQREREHLTTGQERNQIQSQWQNRNLPHYTTGPPNQPYQPVDHNRVSPRKHQHSGDNYRGRQEQNRPSQRQEGVLWGKNAATGRSRTFPPNKEGSDSEITTQGNHGDTRRRPHGYYYATTTIPPITLLPPVPMGHEERLQTSRRYFPGIRSGAAKGEDGNHLVNSGQYTQYPPQHSGRFTYEEERAFYTTAESSYKRTQQPWSETARRRVPGRGTSDKKLEDNDQSYEPVVSQTDHETIMEEIISWPTPIASSRGPISKHHRSKAITTTPVDSGPFSKVNARISAPSGYVDETDQSWSDNTPITATEILGPSQAGTVTVRTNSGEYLYNSRSKSSVGSNLSRPPFTDKAIDQSTMSSYQLDHYETTAKEVVASEESSSDNDETALNRLDSHGSNKRLSEKTADITDSTSDRTFATRIHKQKSKSGNEEPESDEHEVVVLVGKPESAIRVTEASGEDEPTTQTTIDYYDFTSELDTTTTPDTTTETSPVNFQELIGEDSTLEDATTGYTLLERKQRKDVTNPLINSVRRNFKSYYKNNPEKGDAADSEEVERQKSKSSKTRRVKKGRERRPIALRQKQNRRKESKAQVADKTDKGVPYYFGDELNKVERNDLSGNRPEDHDERTVDAVAGKEVSSDYDENDDQLDKEYESELEDEDYEMKQMIKMITSGNDIENCSYVPEDPESPNHGITIPVGTTFRFDETKDKSSCSYWCRCEDDEKDVLCEAIGCLSQDPTFAQNCSMGDFSRKFDYISYIQHRGICTCYGGEFVCERPESDNFREQLGAFLLLGYSEKEALWLQEKVKGNQNLVKQLHHRKGKLGQKFAKKLNRVIRSMDDKCRLKIVDDTTTGNTALQLEHFALGPTLPPGSGDEGKTKEQKAEWLTGGPEWACMDHLQALKHHLRQGQLKHNILFSTIKQVQIINNLNPNRSNQIIFDNAALFLGILVICFSLIANNEMI